MNPFWCGVVVGLVVGMPCGIFVMALCAMAGKRG
jgi:Na+/H+ antiporter NhaA